MEQSESAVACDLTVFGAEERPYHEVLTRQLFTACKEVRELTDGYAFSFPGEPSWCLKLMEWITRERRCCPFLKFEILFGPNETLVRLQLRGQGNAKEVLRRELIEGGFIPVQ